jgi:hypothetical protein
MKLLLNTLYLVVFAVYVLASWTNFLIHVRSL